MLFLPLDAVGEGQPPVDHLGAGRGLAEELGEPLSEEAEVRGGGHRLADEGALLRHRGQAPHLQRESENVKKVDDYQSFLL